MILDLDEQVSASHHLDVWFKTPQGVGVAQAFASEVERIREHLHGAKLLQLGQCGDNLWMSPLQFKQRWVVTPDAGAMSSLVALPQALPLDRKSVDCVIAPLSLEMFAKPQDLLDEIDRVLKPMGYLIVFGINPISLWGAALRLGCLGCYGDVSGTLMSSLRLKHELTSRAYRQCALTSFYYIPPVTGKFWIRKFEFLNQMGKMLWPLPPGFYCLIVQKYERTLTPFLIDPIDDRLLIRY